MKKVGILSISILLSLILLEIILRVISSINNGRRTGDQRLQSEYVILTLGESTTAGAGYSWPSQLEKILNDHYSEQKITVINKGIIGTNTNVLVAHLEEQIQEYHPNLIITMMGINDIFFKKEQDVEYIPNSVGMVHEGNIFSTSKVVNLIHLVQVIINKNFYWITHILLNKNIDDLTSKGDVMRVEKNYSLAEKYFQRALDLDPKRSWSYIKYSWLLRDMFRYKEAEEMLLKSISFNPDLEDSYIELGNLYRPLGDHQAAERMYKRAIQINPNSSWAYLEYANWQADFRNIEVAKDMYRKAIELDPKQIIAYIELANEYRSESKFDEARILYTKALELDKENEQAKLELHSLDRMELEDNEVLPVREKSDPNILIDDYYHQVTQKNYEKMIEIAQNNSINFLAVEYPLRNSDALKALITSDSVKKHTTISIGIINNVQVFRDALAKKRYDELFTDSFGGEFGHATEEGNFILAKNIADTVIKDHLLKL